MWTRRTFLGLLGASALAPAGAGRAVSSPSIAPAMTRRSEVTAFRTFAETTHPRGREAAADHDWRTRWESLATDADTLADGAYFHRLRRALGWLQDGHSTVLPFEFVGGTPATLAEGPFGLALPMRLRVFDDGAWVVAAGAAATPLLGCQVHKIGRLQAGELVRALSVDWPGNDAWAQRWSGAVLGSPAFLQALGAVDEPGASIDFEATSRNGSSIRLGVQSLKNADLPQLAPLERTASPHETWAATAGRGNYVHMLEDGTGYVSLDEMDDVEGQTFETLTKEVFALLQRANVRRLVLDLRRNGGGNNFFGEALRKGVARSRLNRPGGLYVLIGPQTFSAAQNLANRLERETFALFVGEPTGGAPNHYGDAKLQSGAVTGITAMVSTLPWFDSYPQDQRPWILPDLPVPATFADWSAGRDQAFAMAIAHMTDAAAEELSRDRIFFYRRESQRRSWNPFWRT